MEFLARTQMGPAGEFDRLITDPTRFFRADLTASEAKMPEFPVVAQIV